jgi:SAM-dependent methyltransferase
MDGLDRVSPASTTQPIAVRNLGRVSAGEYRSFVGQRADESTELEAGSCSYNPAVMSQMFPEDPYADIAALYDLEHEDYAEDVDLYLNLAQVVGDPILELGCGSGRLLVPLAAAGHRVTGLDVSPAMLDRARMATADAGMGSRITLAQGSMTEADTAPGGPFGLVVIALNGLLHLSSVEAQRETLLAVRRALDPRGQLVIDVLNPTPDNLRGLDHAFGHEGNWRLAGGDRVEKFASRRVSPASQRIETTLWYDLVGADGIVRRTATGYAMRYLHRAELELLLEVTGFVEWRVYGGYDLDPFDDTSERIVVTAEVTPGPAPAATSGDRHLPSVGG